MELEFEAETDFPEGANSTARGIWQAGETKYVVGECGAGPGHKITIPKTNQNA